MDMLHKTLQHFSDVKAICMLSSDTTEYELLVDLGYMYACKHIGFLIS